jgi:hypothetical protein
VSDASTPPMPQTAPALPPARTAPLAIWSLVLAILSWFGCLFLTVLPAIICGHVARSKIRKSDGALGGMNFALAALIIAYLNIPLGVFGGIMLADMIRSERVRSHELALQKKEITSKDGKLKITASGFWVARTDLNKEAALQAACPSKDMFVMIIGDAKSTVGQITLQEHHQLTRDHMMQKMQNASATDSISTTVDGHPALQDEISGNGARPNLVFLHTTIDDGDYFQQILAWTTKSRWPTENGELHEITNSFHSEE